jgi:hypothetical protein
MTRRLLRDGLSPLRVAPQENRDVAESLLADMPALGRLLA